MGVPFCNAANSANSFPSIQTDKKVFVSERNPDLLMSLNQLDYPDFRGDQYWQLRLQNQAFVIFSRIGLVVSSLSFLPLRKQFLIPEIDRGPLHKMPIQEGTVVPGMAFLGEQSFEYLQGLNSWMSCIKDGQAFPHCVMDVKKAVNVNVHSPERPKCHHDRAQDNTSTLTVSLVTRVSLPLVFHLTINTYGNWP